MAVYTHLSQTQITEFLATYDLGSLIAYKGIDGGIENTNYFITTQKPSGTEQDYVLTLFEDLSYEELPYFVALTEHLTARNVVVPTPVRDNHGTALHHLADKPTILFPRFLGDHLPRSAITPDICATIGEKLAKMHVASQSFTLQRQAHRGQLWWQELAPRVASFLPQDEAQMLFDAIQQYASMRTTHKDLPIGVVHGDLFHDNVLFDQTQFSAIIDLYNACNDFLLNDVAVAVNDWCIRGTGEIEQELYHAFIQAYHKFRHFTDTERHCWNTMLKATAMRFWLSRLETYHGLDAHQRGNGVTVLKDPNMFRDILYLRQQYPLALP